jgi:hypothetical protein
MKYEVDFPAELERRLSDKASETGAAVVDLIRIAVGRFVDEETRSPDNGDWSVEMDARRTELIDRDISGTLTLAERAELSELDRRANEHFDRVAPLPIEGARLLHKNVIRSCFAS